MSFILTFLAIALLVDAARQLCGVKSQIWASVNSPLTQAPIESSEAGLYGFPYVILSDNSPLGPWSSKYRKIMLTPHTKLSFDAGNLRLYTPVINLIISGWSFSDWYGATVILVAKAHFALTIAQYLYHIDYSRNLKHVQ